MSTTEPANTITVDFEEYKRLRSHVDELSDILTAVLERLAVGRTFLSGHDQPSTPTPHFAEGEHAICSYCGGHIYHQWHIQNGRIYCTASHAEADAKQALAAAPQRTPQGVHGSQSKRRKAALLAPAVSVTRWGKNPRGRG